MNNLFHEIAHIVEFERWGGSKHAKRFEAIKSELIADFGNAEIRNAKRNTEIARSEYERDTETE